MAFTYTGEQVDLGFGRGWLNRPAAQSIARIDHQLGHPMQITEAGRTWAQQDGHYQIYLRDGYPIALNPDTPSVHQYGGAVDSNEAQRIIAILEDHGWRRTVYRWVNGVWTLVEEWHFEHFAELDNHRNDPTPAGENSAPFTADRKGTSMKEIYFVAPNGTVVHLMGSVKTNFATEGQYSIWREQVASWRAAGATDMVAVPDLGSVPQVDWATYNMIVDSFGAPRG